ncbi:MFS transporter [Streptomyces sp. NPDC051684]|uniref:MFS transporter n=1 Tax=Streptomyces sp. NPDC051684 TaxID=3365670 RepID=UPI0037A342F3
MKSGTVVGPLAGNRTLKVRIAVSFANRLLDSMITSFMAVYLAFTFGAATAGVLLFTVVGLGVAAMLIGGHASEKYGRRRTLMLAEIGVFATFALMAVAHSGLLSSPLLVYLGYLLNRFAASAALPASEALIVDVTTPQTRKEIYTVNYWAVNLGLALGALLGAWLYDGHFDLMLGGAAVCTSGIVLSTVFLIQETRPSEGNRHRTPAGSVLYEFVSGYRLVLRDGRFMRLMTAAALTLAIEFQLINYVGVRLARDFPPQDLFSLNSLTVHVNGVQMLGVLRAENTALVVLLALFARRLFRGLSDRTGLYLGITLFTAGYMTLAVSDSGWVLLVAGLVFTVGELMNVPIKQALLADMVPDTDRSRYMAVYNLNIRVAQMIAALFVALGTLVPSWGIALLYGLIGVVIISQYRAVLSGRPSTV